MPARIHAEKRGENEFSQVTPENDLICIWKKARPEKFFLALPGEAISLRFARREP
jgi:hypothetical protein